MPKMVFEKSFALQARAHALIPGGAHTYAKGMDQYPQEAPGFIARGSGCRVWDVDGNEFIEYGMGLRSVTLGHAHPAVLEAACRQMQFGQNFNRPSPLEVECAEALLGLIRGMDMVKFGKHGSDANSAAIKLARAYTGRDMVAICQDHPFFAVDDWFIGSTPMAAGIPETTRSLTVKFRYNDLESIRKVFLDHPGRIACVLMEPATAVEPAPGFLQQAMDLCHEHGAVFILDEIITGFRYHLGGGQRLYGVVPDLCSFGKALGNGFSVSALAGRRELMELGGLHHNRERVFLMSTTHGAETHCLAAAMKTMEIYEKEGVVEVLKRQGERLRKGVQQAITAAGVEGHFKIIGYPSNLFHVCLDNEKKASQGFRTLFMQELIRRGVLAPSFIVSYAHGDRDIDHTIQAVADSLRVYRMALDEGGVDNFLIGPPSKPVWRQYNSPDWKPVPTGTGDWSMAGSPARAPSKPETAPVNAGVR
jgi:glutamate-1-semialdehyde 2,1-aminomutase